MARGLTEKQREYVKHRARGLPREQSAILAGYKDPEAIRSQVEASPTVQDELAKIRAETAANAGITKDDVLDMLQKAYTLACAAGDAQAIVAAAREIGKICGHYAPTVTKSIIGYDKEGLKKALADMSDAELYKLAHARTIDSTAKRVDGETKRLTDESSDENVQ